ncbi:MAG: nuclease-related domain-containing protein [Syntrophorhabdales bacterium]|jgi:hypothetical protein
MTALMTGLIPFLIFIGMTGILSGVFWYNSRQSHRRSPLTQDLMRSPGHSLVVRIEEISQSILLWTLFATILPVCFYSSYISRKYFGEVKPGEHAGIIYLCLSVGIVVFALIRLLRLQKERRNVRLALDCEMAIGQELNNLLSHGYRVYHDIPAKGFNIDHVAVGPNGVFAVETKGRSKPNRGRGAADARVTFDGKALHFPGSVETEPLHQARRQARWLSRWLTDALAESIPVHAVLALPGWYILRKKWTDVLLLNGRDYWAITTQRTGTPLSKALAQRIGFQLERLCRDVEPKTYKTPRKWSTKTSEAA